MKKLLAPALALLTAIGGFVDIGDIVASGTIGARYGLSLAWVLLIGVVGICSYAEMSGRIVAISGRPVFDLIRERLGPNASLANLIAILAVTLLTLSAQIGGVALVIELATDIPYLAWLVPVGLALWLVLWYIGFERIEQVIGLVGLTVLVFGLSVWWLNPDWTTLAQQASSLFPAADEAAPTYWYYAVALFAAAMTPYSVLFFSSGGVEEGWKTDEYRRQRINVVIGFPLGGMLTLGIMASAAVALKPTGMDVSTLGQVVLPVALAFGSVGLVIALIGFFAVTVGASLEATLSCGYAIGQYFGWPWGKRARPRNAARFHLTLMISLAIAVLVVLTGLDPVQVTEYSLLFSAVALPLTYLPVLMVANDRTYLGEHANGVFANTIGMIMLVVVTVAAIAAIPLMIFTGMGA